MKNGINTYEERLNGAQLLDFTYLKTHPEAKEKVVLRYHTDANFRMELLSSIRNNPRFAKSFLSCFSERLQSLEGSVKGRC